MYDYRKYKIKIAIIKSVLGMRRAGMSFSKISEILNLSDRTVAHKIYKGNKDYVELDYITGEENKKVFSRKSRHSTT